MGIPAVQVKDLPGLPAPVTPGPVAGSFGFVAFGSLTEPLSVGSPPVVPSLVSRVVSPANKRELRTAGGDLSVRPLSSQAAQRRRVLVAWGNVTDSQRADLVSWLRDVVQGGRYSFEVKLDGADSATAIKVRLLNDWEAVTQGLRREVAAVECEEVA
jgi:hypothetical protein